MAAPVSAPVPATDLTWGQAAACAEAGDIAAVEHFITARPFNLNVIEILTQHAARGGQAELVRLLVTKYDADVAVALDNAVDAVEVNTIRGPHFDLIRWLLDPRPGEDPEDYRGRVSDGLQCAMAKGNLALASLFIGYVGQKALSAGFTTAVHIGRSLDVVRWFFHRGDIDASNGIRASTLNTPADVLCYLIERGAVDWPDHVYWRLADNPECVIRLLKFGISRALLTGGWSSIQAILNQHDQWCAHVRETLDDLGVYAVLANLIVQY